GATAAALPSSARAGRLSRARQGRDVVGPGALAVRDGGPAQPHFPAGGGRGVSDHHVRIAHLAVARGQGRLIAVGLGSCVAIVLYDAARRVGGLAHVLLPDPSVARDASNPARFASEVVPVLIDEMRALGARPPFTAKLAGG